MDAREVLLLDALLLMSTCVVSDRAEWIVVNFTCFVKSASKMRSVSCSVTRIPAFSTFISK